LIVPYPTTLTQAQNRNSVAGTCNTNGTAVTRVTGDSFTSIVCGFIEIGGSVDQSGVLYGISSITDADHLVLSSSAGVQSGVYFTAALEIKAIHLNALEAKVGVDDSTDTNSLDNRVKSLESQFPLSCPWRIGDLLPSTREVSAGNPENPNVTWSGTTWALWGSGRMAVGFNSADTDFNTVEKTGGAKTSAVPSHSHSTPALSHQTESSIYNEWATPDSANRLADHPAGTTEAGGDTTLNVLNPYIVCYWWKRTG